MDDSNTIQQFTGADIEKYHTGQLSPAQMHAMEKAALEDPFLADALDGYSISGVHLSADMDELRRRLADKTQEAKVVPLKAVGGGGQRQFPWMRAAAIVIVIAGAGLLAQRMFSGTKEKGIASNNSPAAGKKDNTAGNNASETPVFSNTSDSQTLHGTVADRNSYLKTTDNNTFLDGTKQRENKETTPPVAVNNRTGNLSAGNTVPSSTAITPTNGETERVYQLYKNADGDGVAANKPAGDINVKPGGWDTKPAAPVQPNADSTANTQFWSANTQGEQFRKAKAKKVAPSNNLDGLIMVQDNNDFKSTSTAGGTNLDLNKRQSNGYINSLPANVFHGRVTDVNNVGLPFARIMNPADNNAGTYTDVKGYFTITYPDSTVSVQVRSVGFDNKNLQLRSNLATNQVTLREDKSLAEVVVSTKKPNADRRRDANMKLEEPEPLDGWDNYDTYIANNVEIPVELKSKPAASSAVVEVSFEVNKYGEPVNIKIEKSLCSQCDAEAIRLVKEGPKWRRNANKKGRTTVTISF